MTLTIFEHFNVISLEFTVPLLFIAVSFFARFSDVLSSDTLEHFNTMLLVPPVSNNGVSVLFTFFTVFVHLSCTPLILPILPI